MVVRPVHIPEVTRRRMTLSHKSLFISCFLSGSSSFSLTAPPEGFGYLQSLWKLTWKEQWCSSLSWCSPPALWVRCPLLWVTVLCTVTSDVLAQPLCTLTDRELLPMTSPAFLKMSKLQQNGQHCGIGTCLWKCAISDTKCIAIR